MDMAITVRVRARSNASAATRQDADRRRLTDPDHRTPRRLARVVEQDDEEVRCALRRLSRQERIPVRLRGLRAEVDHALERLGQLPTAVAGSDSPRKLETRRSMSPTASARTLVQPCARSISP